MKAFGYLRVSGPSQLDGDGYPRQLAAIETYAAANGYEIAEVFREKAVSGTKELDDRPALAEMFVALEENGVKTVMIEKLDRLARDLMVQESIIADFQRRGYTLISAYEPDLLSDDPSRKLMRQIMGAIAEYDRAMTVQKLRAARQRKKIRTGKGEGRHAFGEKPEERETLDRILELHSLGHTSNGIALSLNFTTATTDKFHTRSGQPWRGTTIAKIIRHIEGRV